MWPIATDVASSVVVFVFSTQVRRVITAELQVYRFGKGQIRISPSSHVLDRVQIPHTLR